MDLPPKTDTDETAPSKDVEAATADSKKAAHSKRVRTRKGKPATAKKAVAGKAHDAPESGELFAPAETGKAATPAAPEPVREPTPAPPRPAEPAPKPPAANRAITITSSR